MLTKQIAISRLKELVKQREKLREIISPVKSEICKLSSKIAFRHRDYVPTQMTEEEFKAIVNN